MTLLGVLLSWPSVLFWIYAVVTHRMFKTVFVSFRILSKMVNSINQKNRSDSFKKWMKYVSKQDLSYKCRRPLYISGWSALSWGGKKKFNPTIICFRNSSWSSIDMNHSHSFFFTCVGTCPRMLPLNHQQKKKVYKKKRCQKLSTITKSIPHTN